MGRSTIIAIGIVITLLVFVFLVATADNYHSTTTIFTKPNNEITAPQADHVTNNIAAIPEQPSFAHSLTKTLSGVTTQNWNKKIRTAHDQQSGFIAMTIQSPSMEQSKAISTAATKLWLERIQKYYKVPQEVDVKIVTQDLHRGSWREFVLLMSLSLLIGILAMLIAQLISNTIAPCRTKSTPERPSAEYHKPHTESQGKPPSTDPAFFVQKNHPEYIEPTLTTSFDLREERAVVTPPKESTAVMRPKHARAEKRNFVAATARETAHDSRSDVTDLFEIYGHGDQGIGKKMSVAATASAPSNLPVSEPTVQFGESHDEPLSTVEASSKKTKARTHDEDHKEQLPRHVEIRESASHLMEKIVDQKSSPKELEDQEEAVNLFDQDLAKREPQRAMAREEGGAPMNLPIVGVTGKMTASEIQAEAKEARAAHSEDNTTDSNLKTSDPNREPTDDELKERLNQLLRGDLKTRE